MGRSVRQKRKGRSSRAVVKQPNSRKRPVNPTGNAIIAQNWNKTMTLTQNYRRLGLMNRLRQATGGAEKLGSEAAALKAKKTKKDGAATAGSSSDPFAITNRKAKQESVREVRVERDASGKIVRVVEDVAPAHNPLNDPLNDLEDEEEREEAERSAKTYEEWGGFQDEPSASAKSTTPVVRALEKLARQPVGPRHVRYQSAGERDWLQTLVDHYGQAEPDEDTLAVMARDRRRNPFQRTAADLRRRLAQFRAEGGAVSAPISS